ncbi:unnamed protein product, partial [Diplocarpon coronariae]
MRSSLTIYVDC